MNFAARNTAMLGSNKTSSAFKLVHYVDTGNFLVMAGGNKVLRYDENSLYFWDQRLKCEVAIPRISFDSLFAGGPDFTSYGR